MPILIAGLLLRPVPQSADSISSHPLLRRRRDLGKIDRGLAFRKPQRGKANAYFADGIQDEILTRLSKITDLKVISRTSTQHYKSVPENLPEIARELEVAHISEGNVQKSGDIRSGQCAANQSSDRLHVWADTFDRKLTDIFSVESDVAKAIADQLRAKLTGREELIAAIPTGNPEACDAYLRGLAYTLKAGGGTPTNSWRAEISSRSSSLRPEVRPWLGAIISSWNHEDTLPQLCNRQSHCAMRRGRPPRLRYASAQTRRGVICKRILPLRLPERLTPPWVTLNKHGHFYRTIVGFLNRSLMSRADEVNGTGVNWP